MNNITINDKFQPLFDSDARYFILTGGRGSGKSYSATISETTNTFKNGYNCLYTRYTMTAAELSIIPEFREKISLLKCDRYFDVQKKEIVNTITDARVLFRGIKTSSGNQTANLKSLQGISTWVLDEAEEMISEDDFNTIDLSIRSNVQQNRIVLIMNPTTKEHWVYKRFFEEMGVQEGFNGRVENVQYIHSTYLDNKDNLPQDYLNEIDRIKRTNLSKYKHKILGQWLDRADGVVFDNWEYGEFNPNGLQTSFGLDFGYSIDPDALVEVAIDKSKRIIYLKEHIYQKGLGSSQLSAIIKARSGNKLIIADSAEPRLIADLKAKGINIKPVKKGKIEEGVTLMQDFKLIVEPNSNNIGRELNNYVYLDKGSKLYIDDFNHAIDASRYNVTFHLDNPNSGKYHVL